MDNHVPPPYQPPSGAPPTPLDYGYGYAQPQYPEESRAALSLIVSLIGILACGGLLCPVGWYFGKKDLEGIDAGLRDPSKRDMARAGQIVGIIGTLILFATIVFSGLLYGIAISGVLGGTAAGSNSSAVFG